MKSVEQQFASVALHCVSKVKESGTSAQIEDYYRLCHQFPHMILTNGLRLTIAFFQSKEKEKDKESMYRTFLDGMKKALDLPNDWHDIVTNTQASEYRLFTIRVLKAAQWFRRYARALLHQEGVGQSQPSPARDEFAQSAQ